MALLRLLLTLGVCAASLPLAAQTAGDVQIRLLPPTLTTTTFDRRRPPKDMPPAHGDEIGATQSRLGCTAALQIDIARTPNQPPVARLSGATLTLQIDVTMWLPANPGTRIRDHEDGHRHIALAFHTRGAETARTLADRDMGRVLSLPSLDDHENDAFVRTVGAELCQRVVAAVEAPTGTAQRAFDRITDHGRDPIPPTAAAERAIAEALTP